MLQARQTADTLVGGGSKEGRVNLLNWDGKGMPEGLFPGQGGSLGAGISEEARREGEGMPMGSDPSASHDRGAIPPEDIR